jgi:hypothetical protein
LRWASSAKSIIMIAFFLTIPISKKRPINVTLYLSSFLCMSGFAVPREITRYVGPFPYIDGLILQVIQNIGRLDGTSFTFTVCRWTTTIIRCGACCGSG